MIARENERAAERARVAAEAAALRSQVLQGFRRPAGKLYAVDEAAMLLIGPNGAIGTTTLLVRTLAILAAPGRHDPASLIPAGWSDLDHLTAGLDAFAGKLGAVGLRLDRRKTGWRMTKVKLNP